MLVWDVFFVCIVWCLFSQGVLVVWVVRSKSAIVQRTSLWLVNSHRKQSIHPFYAWSLHVRFLFCLDLCRPSPTLNVIRHRYVAHASGWFRQKRISDHRPSQFLRISQWMPSSNSYGSHPIQRFCSPMGTHDDSCASLRQMRKSQLMDFVMGWYCCRKETNKWKKETLFSFSNYERSR